MKKSAIYKNYQYAILKKDLDLKERKALKNAENAALTLDAYIDKDKAAATGYHQDLKLDIKSKNFKSGRGIAAISDEEFSAESFLLQGEHEFKQVSYFGLF